jgi:hypothetical protein
VTVSPDQLYAILEVIEATETEAAKLVEAADELHSKVRTLKGVIQRALSDQNTMRPAKPNIEPRPLIIIPPPPPRNKPRP